NLAENRDYLFGEAGGQIFVVRTAAQVFHRQHGKRHVRRGFAACWVNHFDRHTEAIAALRDGLDKIGPVRSVSKRFAQLRNGVGQRYFFHEPSGPQSTQKLALLHQASPAFQQQRKGVVHLWLERHGLAVAEQLLFGRLKAEAAEFVRDRKAGHTIASEEQ